MCEFLSTNHVSLALLQWFLCFYFSYTAAHSAFKQQLQMNSEQLSADFFTGSSLSPVTMNKHLQDLQVSVIISWTFLLIKLCCLCLLFLCIFTKHHVV